MCERKKRVFTFGKIYFISTESKNEPADFFIVGGKVITITEPFQLIIYCFDMKW